MTTVLPRRNEEDIPDGMFIRPRNPNDHRQFEEILPWMTPLYVYRMTGRDWVRWAVPPHLATEMSLAEGCACCGGTAPEHNGDYTVDTAWNETSFWLERNGYKLPAEGAERKS